MRWVLLEARNSLMTTSAVSAVCSDRTSSPKTANRLQRGKRMLYCRQKRGGPLSQIRPD